MTASKNVQPKWTCEKSMGGDSWLVDNWLVCCNGEYMGTIMPHESIRYHYRYVIPGMKYAHKSYPTVKRAMTAMRQTLRWRKKKALKAAT